MEDAKTESSLKVMNQYQLLSLTKINQINSDYDIVYLK